MKGVGGVRCHLTPPCMQVQVPFCTELGSTETTPPVCRCKLRRRQVFTTTHKGWSCMRACVTVGRHGGYGLACPRLKNAAGLGLPE